MTRFTARCECLVTYVYELPECGVFAGVVPRSGVLAWEGMSTFPGSRYVIYSD